MSVGAWVGVITLFCFILFSVVTATWILAKLLSTFSRTIGELTVHVGDLTKKVETLFDLWNTRQCEKHTAELDTLVQRVGRLEKDN